MKCIFCLRTQDKVSYLLMYKGAGVLPAYLIQKGEYNEYCTSFLKMLLYKRSNILKDPSVQTCKLQNYIPPSI